MPKFVFKLDPVLRMREREEGEKRRIVADLDRVRLEFETMIRSLQNQIIANKQELGGHLVGRVDTHAIRSQASMTMQFNIRAQQTAIQLADLYQRLDRARGDLIEASKRRKAIEWLRDSRFQIWKKEQEKREAAELDDLVNTRFGRSLFTDQPVGGAA